MFSIWGGAERFNLTYFPRKGSNRISFNPFLNKLKSFQHSLIDEQHLTPTQKTKYKVKIQSDGNEKLKLYNFS